MVFLNSVRKLISHSFTESSKIAFSDNDVVLVSYPKSGNTWVRFFMANVLFKKKRPIHFMNVVDLVPEIFGKRRNRKKFLTKQSKFTVFKSHELFSQDYPKVIYILRDGRDVYVSYYYYLMHNLPENTTFAEFLKNEKFYPVHWKDHCESWLFNNFHNNILLVRYEDLKRDPVKEFKKISLFAGLSPTKEELDEAIQCSNFDSMKRLESLYGRPFKKKQIPTKANRFVRKGRIGDWKEHFSNCEKEIFKQINGEMLIKLGYEHNNNW